MCVVVVKIHTIPETYFLFTYLFFSSIILSQPGKLKTLKRTGWVNNEVFEPESVADHMYRMSMLTFLIVDPTVEKDRLMKVGTTVLPTRYTVLVTPFFLFFTLFFLLVTPFFLLVFMVIVIHVDFVVVVVVIRVLLMLLLLSLLSLSLFLFCCYCCFCCLCCTCYYCHLQSQAHEEEESLDKCDQFAHSVGEVYNRQC